MNLQKQNSTKTHEYAIVIGETVKNRSVGPKGFDRYKPAEYDNAKTWHSVMYKKEFLFLSKNQAIITALEVFDKMDYYKGRRQYSTSPMSEFCVVLHDKTEDRTVSIEKDIFSDNGIMFHGIIMSNETLELLENHKV